MLTGEEIHTWKEADRVLVELLDLPPDQRLPALRQRDLAPAVKACAERLLQASEGRGMLDGELRVAPPIVAAADMAGQRFGTWRLVEEIGRGGMAVVYRAEREGAEFDQSAAVKLLPRGLTGHERFRVEQRVLARLEHPNIARMLDGGVTEDGTPWLAMELVDGVPIDRHCDGKSPREVVRLFGQVVDAVGYAHRHLVVHRDLKPGNVLVDAAGRVRLLDFGIAKLLSEEGGGPSTRIMTADYAAPEQHEGGEVSTATDVYGLGAILFALLTGEPPRARDGARSEALHHADLDTDLKNIVRKALRDQPQDRYATARAMGDDLRRWLEGLPVEATAGSRRYRAGKWLRRHQVGAAATALVLVALVLAVALVLRQAQETRRQLELSRATTEFLVRVFEEADPVVAEGAPTTARELLSRAEKSLASIDDPAIRDALLVAMARAWFGMGDFAQATATLERGLASGLPGQSDEVRLLYARAAHAAGQVDKAIAFLEALPEPQRSALAVRRLLGRYYSAAARYAEADAELEAALANLDPATEAEAAAEVRIAAAMNHITQGRYEEARAMLGQARASALANESWRQQAEIAQMSGEVAEIQGRHEDALVDYQAARRLYERVYSADHSIMIDIAKAEAQALRNLGRHAEALAQVEAAAELARARLGDNPLTVNVLNSLGIAREQAGDLPGAIAAAREAEAMMLRRGDEAHPLRANLLANIANYHITLGQLEEAEALSTQAEAILWQSLPADHPVFVHTQFQMARIRSRQGRAAETLEILQSLVPRAMVSPGPGNHLTISILRDVARQQLRLGRAGEALETFERAAGASAGFPADSPLRTYVELGLAEALLATGEVERAAGLVQAHARRLGAGSETPDGQTVFTEALLALHQGDVGRSRELLARTRELMSIEADGGLAYRPEVEALAARIGG